MGGGDSRSAEILRFVEREWQVLREGNGVRVLRNIQSQIEAEMVPIMLDPRRNFDKQCDIYNYRRTQENALVHVYAVHNSKNTESSFCGNVQILKVVVERIVKRYHDFTELSFPEVLYTLSQSIRGFDDCFGRIGLFEINSRMIGVNIKGAIKVWLNENFANNHPVDERPQLHMTCVNQSKLKQSREELLMLQNLLNVIEEKCEGGRFPQDFRNKIYTKSNFVDAYNQVELYCRDRGLEIPDHITISPSNINTSNSISFQQSNAQKPRETIIRDLAFSQTNEKHYIESPQLKKYEVPVGNPIMTSEVTRPIPYQQIQSPRSSKQIPQFVQTQPNPIKINFQNQNNSNGYFASRRF